jgi:ubiquinone/menaquinone biosynthesis C-methylase UbiE
MAGSYDAARLPRHLMTARDGTIPGTTDRLSVEHQIPGGYQLDALLRGRPFQRAWHRARLDLVEHVLPPAKGSLVLDAAAGSGMITWKFRQSTIVSADIRVTACQAIRMHTPGARAATADLGALPFRSAVFSQIYFLEALEHLSDEKGRQTLEELRRVAAPGARCLITTPNYRSHWVLLERLIDALQLTPPIADAQHVSQYDSDSLARKAESCGWTVTRTGSFNLLAPLVGMVSQQAAGWTVGLEASRGGNAGALLYAVCQTNR